MRKNKVLIPITIPLCYLVKKSIRIKLRDHGLDDEKYAVLHLSFDSPNNNDIFGKIKGRRETRHKFIVMCFREEVFERLVEEDRFTFRGTIELVYGGVYITATKVYDSLGINVEDEESIYYNNYKPIAIDLDEESEH